MWSNELLCGREELGFSELLLNCVWCGVEVAGDAERKICITRLPGIIYIAGNILCSNKDAHVLCASVGD